MIKLTTQGIGVDGVSVQFSNQRVTRNICIMLYLQGCNQSLQMKKAKENKVHGHSSTMDGIMLKKKYCHGATTTSNLFPEEMRGCLDKDQLFKLGMNASKVQNCDALFFFQLLWPICEPSRSGVEGDTRIPFFTLVEQYTNIYKFTTGQGGTYGHKWNNVVAEELLHFFGILVRDGVLGGSHGALDQRWNPHSPMYCHDIAQSMTLTRFGEIKQNIKL